MAALFTPRASSNSSVRLNLEADKTDLGWRESYTVLTTDGHKFKVRRASCGLPGCRCDAVIVACLDAEES
jgi:hypothetical protein